MLYDILATPDIAGIVLANLKFQAVCDVSQVSKVVNQSHDWRALLDNKVAKFVNGTTYLSAPTGCAPTGCDAFTVTRKTMKSKTVKLDGPTLMGPIRRKVHMMNGVEYVLNYTTRFDKFQETRASDALIQ